MSDPRWATAPTEGARHDLGQVRAMAEALGTPLMPWQEQVARVATERDPADPRRFRYQTVIITVPRQSGKTTLMRTVLAQRALATRGRRAFYTAQTGKDATARWKDLIQAIDSGPLAGRVDIRLGAGAQAIRFPNGSSISPFAPTPKSLHGYTPHDVFMDEVFAWTTEEGEDLMGAVKPAQITLPDRQLWLVSTMGTVNSGFLNHWVSVGRQATTDPGSNVAYFEWSAPDGADYWDPTTWAFHPALGHTITERDLAEAAEAHSPGEWQRAYMNRQSRTVETWLDMPTWDAAADADQAPPARWQDVALAYEADPDRRRGAIVAAWRAAGALQVRLVRAEDGTEWLPRAVAELADERRPGLGIWADDAGHTRAITEQLARTETHRWGKGGVPVTTLTARDFATACGVFRAELEAGTLRHGDSPAMRDALSDAATRPMGEAVALSRRHSAGPIPEAVAAVVALRGLTQQRVAVRPRIYLGGAA
ncbi:hypothetical protein M3686_04745 [Micrococcus luteus]|uniref:hypothetical protein n=1 Tax=Micrococcus luteus TaxID=1270 RepID=UPI00203CA4D3|nr:hypothetical protein [Micrococcus luteus]MCM3577442.1 hypothetical protein [Micrococcus luteus]